MTPQKGSNGDDVPTSVLEGIHSQHNLSEVSLKAHLALSNPAF